MDLRKFSSLLPIRFYRSMIPEARARARMHPNLPPSTAPERRPLRRQSCSRTSPARMCRKRHSWPHFAGIGRIRRHLGRIWLARPTMADCRDVARHTHRKEARGDPTIPLSKSGQQVAAKLLRDPSFGPTLVCSGRCWPNNHRCWPHLAENCGPRSDRRVGQHFGRIWPQSDNTLANIGQSVVQVWPNSSARHFGQSGRELRPNFGHLWPASVTTGGQHRSELARLGPKLSSRSTFCGNLVGTLG